MNQVALSWSGGKDSCMALHELVKAGKMVACLVTTVPVETGKTFVHDENTEKIEAQANSLGIPVEFVKCSYDTYSEDFLIELKRLKDKYNLNAIAFGDMYLEGHREWGQKLADAAGLEAAYPLWSEESLMMNALKSFIDTGFKANIIRVREDVLPADWVGRALDEHFLKDISKKEVCPMGESGEYHTYVFDGPLFKRPIKV